MTEKHNGIKNTTILPLTIRTLHRSVESERKHKFNFKQQDTLYQTPLNYFKIEGFESRINLPENLTIELEPSVRLILGKMYNREDSTVNISN